MGMYKLYHILSIYFKMSRKFNNNTNIRETNNPNAMETSAHAAVNANLLVVCSLFKWHKVHFYCTSKKIRVCYTKLNELYYYQTNKLFNDQITQLSYYCCSNYKHQYFHTQK